MNFLKRAMLSISKKENKVFDIICCTLNNCQYGVGGIIDTNCYKKIHGIS